MRSLFLINVMVCFTANPDDYSRSGKIISQLKDRIGSEIRTHYPKTRQIGLEITKQEIKLPLKTPEIIVPAYIEEIIEEITIQARSSHLVNQKSGVSARLSIANYEPGRPRGGPVPVTGPCPGPGPCRPRSPPAVSSRYGRRPGCRC